MNPIFWKTAGGLISPGGSKGKLSIVIFHSVCEKADPLKTGSVPVNDFDRLISFLSRTYNVLPLSDAIQKLKSNELPKRALSITFDDGYADNYLLAQPILKKWGMTATFFVATGFLDGGIMWNDSINEMVRSYKNDELDLTPIGLDKYSMENWKQRKFAAKSIITSLKYLEATDRLGKVNKAVSLSKVKLPNNLMLTTPQLQEMFRSGMEIGGHTVNHPILKSVNNDVAWKEITEGKNKLEDVIDTELRVFAYPNGQPGIDYTHEHVEMIKKAGFTGAVSTSWGVSTAESDSYQLARFTPWNRETNKFALKMFLNYSKRGKID